MEKINFTHYSVMLNECIEGLNIKPDGIYVDGTLGGAGHSLEIVKHLKNGRLIAIDKDDDALEFSREKLKEYSDKITFVKEDFKNLKNVLLDLGISKVDGILLDLGVSSYQIDTPERGFSYRFNGQLDMRMDKENNLSAYDVVNHYSEQKLIRILYEFGEESFAKNIVRNIVSARLEKPIETTNELTDIIERSIPKKFQTGGSVCKKTFQAIRIEVNGELQNLECKIGEMARCLNPDGRMVVLTFHSLEDRCVKNAFRLLAQDCICDKSIPICICNHKAEGKLITRKPVEASKNELLENKRSSSAKLRIFEKN